MTAEAARAEGAGASGGSICSKMKLGVAIDG
jgi:hypothetical protein